MDAPLRNSLWTALKLLVWDNIRDSYDYGGVYLSSGNDEMNALCRSIWINYFKKPIDEMNDAWDKTLPALRGYFFGCKWNEALDFIEFVSSSYKGYQFKEHFISKCNQILETERSAYRFVNGVITPITDKQEIEEIQGAIDNAKGPVQIHLNRALELLSNRSNPDHRNSIKEAISAVESLVSSIIGKKGTLGDLIKKLGDEIGLHSSLKTAFYKLYGYTSDEGGIRHALLEETDIDFADSKFMLVVCSAFINYVNAKVKKSVN